MSYPLQQVRMVYPNALVIRIDGDTAVIIHSDYKKEVVQLADLPTPDPEPDDSPPAPAVTEPAENQPGDLQEEAPAVTEPAENAAALRPKRKKK